MSTNAASEINSLLSEMSSGIDRLSDLVRDVTGLFHMHSHITMLRWTG